MKPNKGITADDILQRLVRAISQASDGHQFIFVDDSLRWFEIKKLAKDKFYPYELEPTGVVVNKANGKDIFTSPNGMKDAYVANRNGLGDYCEQHNIDPESLCRNGGGLCADGRTKTFISLTDACEAIAESINQNQRLDTAALRPTLNRAQALMEKRRETLDSINYWQAELAKETNATGFLSGASNLIGALSDESAKLILSYINKPSEEIWDQIYCTAISSTTTLWAAWGKYNPSAPKSKPTDSGWPLIPSGEELRDAIVNHLSVRKTQISDKLAALSESLSRIDGELKLSEADPMDSSPSI